MSGPKYYNFPVSSAEEAAGIYAQLSSFQQGVKIRVVNNELRVEVSENAWYQGASYSAIQSEIAKAKKRYTESEEMKRLIKENKEKAKAKVTNKKTSIEAECKQEKDKLDKARQRCSKIKSENILLRTTPFGTYDLTSEFNEVKEAEATIFAELSSLGKRKADCLAACNNVIDDIDRCNSMSELTTIQRRIETIDISSSNIVGAIEHLELSIRDKAARLKSFTAFLDKLYEGMKNKDLTGYFERIKQEVAGIDIFDFEASKKIEKILEGLETEISLLKEKETSIENDRAIKERVAAQLKLLNDLSRELKPVLESITVENKITADYTQKSIGIVNECDEILTRINQLDFINGENKGVIDRLTRDLQNSRTSMMSKATIEKLGSIVTSLHKLEDTCKKNQELYKQFEAEYKRYEELYVTLQGFLSPEKSAVENAEKYLPSPVEVFFAKENPEKEIEDLKAKNQELTKIVNECRQESLCGAIAATVTAVKDSGQTQGEAFRKEKHKGGSLHFTYVRKENKGAIFDVDCGVDGGVGIYPRGVVLYNGKTTISAEELKMVHSSCGWADEIHDAFTSFGMTTSGNYEEMPKEVLESLYDLKNYYHISTFEESVRFLELSGYSKEEIITILEIEQESNEEERKPQRRVIESNLHAIKK